jgi:hypothetical protein
MSELKIELCPETGICSIIKSDGKKVDLMPNEVGEIREATDSTDSVKAKLSEVDSGFADSLDSDELTQVLNRLK